MVSVGLSFIIGFPPWYLLAYLPTEGKMVLVGFSFIVGFPSWYLLTTTE